MELTQLNYFRVLARVGNMTHAANELHITQPALSRSINALEVDLGVPLFDRTKGKLALNRAGELFLETADRVFIEVQNGLSRVNALTNEDYPSIHYGVSHYGLVTMGLTAFLEQHPHLRVTEELLPMDSIVSPHGAKARMETLALDFCLTSSPVHSPVVDTCQLYSDYCILVMHKDHPLSQQTSVSNTELAELPLIIASSHYQYDAVYATPNFAHNVFYEGEDALFALSLVTRNLGCMMTSLVYYRWIQDSYPQLIQDLVTAPITKNGRAVPCNIYISVTKNRKLPLASKQLIDFLTAYYEGYH